MAEEKEREYLKNDGNDIIVEGDKYIWGPSLNAFTDVAAIHIERVRAVNWIFEITESKSSDKARNLFGPMQMTPYPFTSFLPFPESCYYRFKPIVQKWWEKKNYGFYPFETMSVKQNTRFLKRDISLELPYADIWLNPVKRPPREHWEYSGFNKTAPRLIRRITHLERRVRKVFI